MAVPPTQDIEMTRTEAKLLTVAALYLLPITIGLRTDGFGPNYLIMMGLLAITVSKVVHLREAVVLSRAYPRSLMYVDFSLVLLLIAMFQCLARPHSLNIDLWSPDGYRASLALQSDEASLRNTWMLFWSLGILLFILIPIWTYVARRSQNLRRVGEWRYWFGWFIGALVSGVMLCHSVSASFEEAFAWYRIAAPIALLPFVFLFLELREEKLFESIPATAA